MKEFSIRPKDKLEAMKRGETVVTNDRELDAMLALADDAAFQVRSLPNPRRVGVLDQYEAWIGPSRSGPCKAEDP